MTYDEIKKQGEEKLEDFFQISESTEREKHLMLIAYTQGFVSGELQQIREHINKLKS